MQTSLALPFSPSHLAFALLYSAAMRSFSVFISALVSAANGVAGAAERAGDGDRDHSLLEIHVISSCVWLYGQTLVRSSNIRSLRFSQSLTWRSASSLRDAVAFLDPAHQLLAPAVDHVEMVVGQLAPLLLDAALDLLPVALRRCPSSCRVS